GDAAGLRQAPRRRVAELPQGQRVIDRTQGCLSAATIRRDWFTARKRRSRFPEFARSLSMTIAAPRLAALLATSLLATTPALASVPVAPPPPARIVVAPVVSYD